MKRRIRIEWTCSDFATHHRHRTYFGAWLCGRAQWLTAILRAALVLVLLPALSWAQKPTVVISGDGAATVVSVGTQGPPGANIPAGGSEGQGVCKSGSGLGWCSTFLCTGGTCTFSVPVLVSDGGGIAFSGEPTTKFWRNVAGAIDVDFSGINGMRLQSGALRLLTAGGTIYAGAASDAQIGRDAASTWQLGADAVAAMGQTLKGPDSTGAGNAGGDLTLSGGAGGAGGTGGTVRISDPGTKPACNAGIRGAIWYEAGTGGVADSLEVCRKDAADVYLWVALY